MRYLPRAFDVFDDMFDGFFPARDSELMKCDVHEKDGYLNLDIDLPGYKKEDISIEILDGYMNIKAKHNTTDEERDAKGNLIRSERMFGSCSRSFYVGDNIKSEDIKASFENGVLNISMPSKQQKAIETKQTVSID